MTAEDDVRAVAKKRELDICERCHKSAWVDEGKAWFDRPADAELPEWHFVCAKCSSN